MCRPASMIVTRTGVLFAPSDSHENIKLLWHLRDDHPVKRSWVPIEIYPKTDGCIDYTRPWEEWKIHTDLPRGEWPEWYSEGEAEVACRAVLPQWLATRKTFDCSGIEGVIRLPALPVCERLDCSRCTGLSSLPALPVCEWLCCSRCTGLSSLPALPVCKRLNCSYCTGLSSLPAMPVCKRLNCSDCTGLESTPDQEEQQEEEKLENV